MQFFARSFGVLLAGELLGGLVLGTYAVIAPYASEVCPIALRGVLTSYVNLCFVMGQLIANGIIAGTHNITSHWAYSAPFAAQWFWPVVILAGLPFAPESPWWLVRKGREDDALQALRRLAADSVDVKATLAVIIETDRLEQELEAGSTYLDCFKKINIHRTEIAIGVYSIQVISGIYLVGYATYFFELAGLPDDQAFDMGVGFLAVGFVGKERIDKTPPLYKTAADLLLQTHRYFDILGLADPFRPQNNLQYWSVPSGCTAAHYRYIGLFAKL